MKIKLVHKFEEIVSVDNLLCAWKEFLKDKRNRLDVQKFSLKLINNILPLNNELVKQVYKHGGYEAFKINDPKPRDIHKASVRDRLLHHALYRILYPFFNRKFIADSFSCRIGKGTHKAINRFKDFSYKVSKNNTQTCYVLKCDIRKFFANIDHEVLMEILKEYIEDEKLLRLLEKIICSFSSDKNKVGLPLGNLTSQLFVNIYMNKFDQFVKHNLKAKYYIRYCDDFVIFSDNRGQLENYLPQINRFLLQELKLELHPQKVFIKTIASGVDFLGWVNFPDYKVLRTTTKKRMFKKLKENNNKHESVDSYLGLLSHGNTYKLKNKVVQYIEPLYTPH
ncbi:MAG: reverse transcriptase/maturase family protein [Patescibacteria group bacterium]